MLEVPEKKRLKHPIYNITSAFKVMITIAETPRQNSDSLVETYIYIYSIALP